MHNAKREYYQQLTNFYAAKCDDYLYGANRAALAIHAGFTDDDVQDYAASQQHMNAVLAERAAIQAGDQVLDAGCGVGGSAIWLAKHRGARVAGITLVQRQLEFARRFAREEGVLSEVDFLAADFTRTPFAGQSFDVIWAIESACHALDKADFINEAARLLKPGGRLVVADGFQSKPQLTPEEHDLLHSWLSSWVVPHLATPESFFASLRQAGFKKIDYQNVTENVMPFSLRLYLSALQAKAEEKQVTDWRDLSAADLEDIHGTRDQMRSLASDIWQYGIFLVVKPVLPKQPND
ncbi:MAG: methyltransferase domain-containing protein [Anaerolineales bacterium]|nr:methyltransferase domain-containing protein [Anaerolineales bacterium]